MMSLIQIILTVQRHGPWPYCSPWWRASDWIGVRPLRLAAPRRRSIDGRTPCTRGSQDRM